MRIPWTHSHPLSQPFHLHCCHFINFSSQWHNRPVGGVAPPSYPPFPPLIVPIRHFVGALFRATISTGLLTMYRPGRLFSALGTDPHGVIYVAIVSNLLPATSTLAAARVLLRVLLVSGNHGSIVRQRQVIVNSDGRQGAKVRCEKNKNPLSVSNFCVLWSLCL